MLVSILTCPRSPTYFHQTLASMIVSDPESSNLRIRVVVDADDDSHMSAYSHNSRIETVRIDSTSRQMCPGDRITAGFLLGLQKEPISEGILLMEDDVVFRDGWTTALRIAMEEASRRSTSGKFIVAGYASYHFSSRPISLYPSSKFYGTQCCYVSPHARRDLTEYLRSHIGTAPVDILVGRYSSEVGTPIWATVPSLVQHIGTSSAIGSVTHHTTPMWIPKKMETFKRPARESIVPSFRRPKFRF